MFSLMQGRLLTLSVCTAMPQVSPLNIFLPFTALLPSLVQRSFQSAPSSPCNAGLAFLITEYLVYDNGWKRWHGLSAWRVWCWASWRFALPRSIPCSRQATGPRWPLPSAQANLDAVSWASSSTSGSSLERRPGRRSNMR